MGYTEMVVPEGQSLPFIFSVGWWDVPHVGNVIVPHWASFQCEPILLHRRDDINVPGIETDVCYLAVEGLLISVCGEGASFSKFENAVGRPPRYGIQRLREILDDVAECVGPITRRLYP